MKWIFLGPGASLSPASAGVVERQTRWFKVPVLRSVRVQIPPPAPLRNKYFSLTILKKYDIIFIES